MRKKLGRERERKTKKQKQKKSYRSVNDKSGASWHFETKQKNGEEKHKTTMSSGETGRGYFK